jgi:hypothetical protein
LLSATANNAAATVNTDSDSIGSANQSMDGDDGETVRIDFVSDLTTGAATPTGFGYTGHVDTNSYLQTIPQVQGSQTETVAFRVYALDTTDTQANAPDSNPAGGFTNSTIITVTEVTVIGFGVTETTPITVNISGVAVDVWTTVGYGISVQKQGDGSVIFSGVQEGDQYGISTGAIDFNAIAVTALAAGVGPVGNLSTEDSFDLGVFAIGQVDSGEPIDISFDLSITDADGDTVTMPGAIDITFEPESESLAVTSFAAQEEQLQKSAANSNTLTLAAAVAAAGMVESAAAHEGNGHNGRGQDAELMGFAAPEVVEQYSAGDDSSNEAVSLLAAEPAGEESAAANSSSSTSDNKGSSNSLDDSGAKAAPESNDAPAADEGAANSSADAVGPVAPTVAMVSAEALEAAANDNGSAQQGGSVEQIVADALDQGGAADLDAVLANLPDGGNGALQALAHMASPDGAAVSSWHMGSHGAVGAGFDMMFKMDVATHHQDAVQPVANG